MSGHHKFSKLDEKLRARPGAAEAMARADAELAEELRLYELRHAEAVSQVELAGRLDVTPSRRSNTPKTSASQRCANPSKLSARASRPND